MANDFNEVWNKVLLRAPIDPGQAQSFVKDAFQQFAERREWSWMIRNSTFAPPNLYNTGLATATPGTANVVGTDTNWTQAMIGRQFRFGIFTPIYTITAVQSPTVLLLDQPWIGQQQVSQGYLIYQAYYSTPPDFREWLTLKDPQNNFKLHTNIMQPQLDFWDPQRSQNQTPRCVSFLDYGGGMNGSQGDVGNMMRVGGFGMTPTATTTLGYSYPGSATYIITIQVGGSPGDDTLTFNWFRIADGVATPRSEPQQVPDNTPIDLSDGVQVYFPTALPIGLAWSDITAELWASLTADQWASIVAGNSGITYTTGDIFIVNCEQDAVQPQTSPRYEMWPHPMTQLYYYPFLYVSKIPEFDEKHPQLPPFVRRDVILELALEKSAMYPGVSVDSPNPYYSLTLAARHRASYERMAMDLEIKDDATAIRDFVYQDQTPWAPMPFMDGSWLRDHAVPSGSW